MKIDRLSGRKASIHCDLCDGDHLLVACQGELDPQEHFFVKGKKVVCAACREELPESEKKKLKPLTKDKIPKKLTHRS